MYPENFYSEKYGGTKKLKEENIHTANARGFVAAGEDDMEQGIDLNKELIRNKPATFFLRVNCDSMKDAGIYKNDIVIVDRSLKPANGKVIIAILSGDLLIRRFEKVNNKIRLLADGDKLSPINIENGYEDFGIWGVVTYVIHKPSDP